MARSSAHKNWIDGLPSSSREAVHQYLQSRRVADGEVVYSVGDLGRECYLIRSGRIRITNYSYSGKEVQTLELRDGDCFGEVSVIDGLPRSDNAEASGATELWVLGKPDFDRLYVEHSAIARQLNLYLCHRLRMISANAEDVSMLVLRERLPRLLSRLADRHGVREDSGDVLIRRISHADLARMLGVTRQSVSRELKELERAGLVRLRYRQILVRDIAGFTQRFDSLVGGEPSLSRSTD